MEKNVFKGKEKIERKRERKRRVESKLRAKARVNSIDRAAPRAVVHACICFLIGPISSAPGDTQTHVRACFGARPCKIFRKTGCLRGQPQRRDCNFRVMADTRVKKKDTNLCDFVWLYVRHYGQTAYGKHKIRARGSYLAISRWMR